MYNWNSLFLLLIPVILSQYQNFAAMITAPARDLSGKSGLLFRRNSLTGALECLTNKSAIELNLELHKNN